METTPPHIHGPTVDSLRARLRGHVPYQPGLDLDELIYALVLEFDLLRPAGASKDQRKAVAAICAMAQQLLTSDSLPLPQTGLFERIIIEGEDPTLTQALQVEWALRMGTDVSGMTERAINIAEQALGTPVAPRVQPYLRRLARCLLLGLSPETIIMCRAVLEIALKETFTRLEPMSRFASDKARWHEQIARAVEIGWISSDLAARANEVRKLGNSAVHRDPGAVSGQEWTAFRDTMAILEQFAAA